MPCPLCGAALHPTATTCEACGAVTVRKLTAISVAMAIGGVLLLATGLALAMAVFTVASLGQIIVGTAMILFSGRFRKVAWVSGRFRKVAWVRKG